MNKIGSKKFFLVIFSFFVILSIGLLSYLGVIIYSDYKEDIIDEQKKQLQLISDSSSNGITEMLKLQVNGFNFLLDNIVSTAEFNENTNETLLQYKENNIDYVESVFITNKNKDTIYGINNLVNFTQFSSYTYADGIIITEYVSEDKQAYFNLSKDIDEEYELNVVVNISNYYNNVIGEIKVGNEGYVVVKNSQGIILMHPASVQIGYHLIQGREENYEGVDLSSLEQLFLNQKTYTEGVYEYYSYWWLEDELQSIPKLSAHTQNNIGDDFIIVSAVIDYYEIINPINESLQRISIIFILILLIVLLFTVYIVRLLILSRKDKKEISYLKKLNTVLEETRKVEESISHNQRLQVIGTMTSGVAHEVNNMLTPIIGYTELLKTMFENSDEQIEFLEEILESCNKTKGIIKQISSLGKKESDRNYKYVTAEAVMKSSLKLIKSSCPKEIEFDFKSGITDIEKIGFLGNETQINQVVLNLFVNSAHALKDKKDAKINLAISSISKDDFQKLYGISLSPVWQNYMQISLKDNGMGIDDAILENIFDPFFTTKSAGTGTGLGLFLSRQILLSHNGYIFVESEKNVGSEFFIYLPIINNFSSEKDIIKNNIIILSKENIDNSKFEKNNVNVYTAKNITEAKHILREKSVGYIIADENSISDIYPNMAINFLSSIMYEYPNSFRILITSEINKDIVFAKNQGWINETYKNYDEILLLLNNNDEI